MERQRLAGQRLLQRRHSPGLGILDSRQHRSRREHIAGHGGGRDTGVNLRPAQLISLDRLPLQLSRLLTTPSLNLTPLSEELPGSVASNRSPTNTSSTISTPRLQDGVASQRPLLGFARLKGITLATLRSGVEPCALESKYSTGDVGSPTKSLRGLQRCKT